MPVLNTFKDAIITLKSIQSKHFWQPYIGAQFEENLAISKVWNDKSKMAFSDGCDFVVILNDDSWMSPWGFDELIRELQEGVNLHLVSGTDTAPHMDARRPHTVKKTGLHFSCFAISPQLFELAGTFDEHFYPIYFEDNDIHRRMQLLNLPAYGVNTAQFFHANGGSTTTRNRHKLEDSSSVHRQFEINREYYIRKWGGMPGEERFNTPFNDPDKSVKEWKFEDKDASVERLRGPYRIR